MKPIQQKFLLKCWDRIFQNCPQCRYRKESNETNIDKKCKLKPVVFLEFAFVSYPQRMHSYKDKTENTSVLRCLVRVIELQSNLKKQMVLKNPKVTQENTREGIKRRAKSSTPMILKNKTENTSVSRCSARLIELIQRNLVVH